jgi:hypothetical protein
MSQSERDPTKQNLKVNIRAAVVHSKGIPDRLIVAQLINKFRAFYGSRSFITVFITVDY